MVWHIAGIFALGALIASVEIPALLKKKRKKDMWAVFLLLGTGIVMNVATILDLNIPSPLNWIKAVYEPFGKAILSILS
ncbi:hypothetical protein [Paenibacillus sedimenti]|uniref:Uncharacterized protein n=1 Tax=Paenibacillus sedimenti TaxID=2770274 RepID=A0A926QLY5_9BACL|nr:hypothetical protein [Paenibacillus sedimenti]MBD0382869.1 hypothetical protein [Paenibacillus sedimenti]